VKSSRYDTAIDSIEAFLAMENSPSIVLFLYKSDKTRLSKRYPQLTFLFMEQIADSNKPQRYLIQK